MYKAKFIYNEKFEHPSGWLASPGAAGVREMDICLRPVLRAWIPEPGGATTATAAVATAGDGAGEFTRGMFVFVFVCMLRGRRFLY
jgi:hypothetical protein